MYDEIFKKIIHIFIAIFITVLIATIIALLILKYNVEGEENIPFEVSKIMVVSTAEGIENEDKQTKNKWNLRLIQNNDIYLEISKNKNYEETEIIDKIIIDNLEIREPPKKGTIRLYKPTQKENTTYENIEENEIKERLEYIGKENSNTKNLEIANQGGLLLFRYTLEDLGTYTSDVDEIKHDGTILGAQNIEYEEIKCELSFDLSIQLKSDIIYTATVTLDLPVGNIIEEGTSHYERTDLKDLIFRRKLW